MPVFGSSPLVNLDIVLEHIRENDLDPATARSCAPSQGLPGHMPGVVGCNMCDRCPFDRPHNGGKVKPFKGRGPKTIIYYLKVNDSTNHQAENEMPCYRFVQVFGDRKVAADMALAQGKRGNPGPEVIEIVGVEGDEYLANVQVNKLTAPFNPKNEQGRFEFERKRVIATEYRHPSPSTGDSYEAELERRRIDREAAREPQPFQRMTEDTDTEAPVKRGPGRPRKDAAPISAEPVT